MYQGINKVRVIHKKKRNTHKLSKSKKLLPTTYNKEIPFGNALKIQLIFLLLTLTIHRTLIPKINNRSLIS